MLKFPRYSCGDSRPRLSSEARLGFDPRHGDRTDAALYAEKLNAARTSHPDRICSWNSWPTISAARRRDGAHASSALPEPEFT
jgi:hypothetical protein